MSRYILRRVFQAVLTVVFVITLVFFIARLTGDPTYLLLPPEGAWGQKSKEQLDLMRANLGLDKPLYVQYLVFWKNLARGDFGESYRFLRPNLDLIKMKLPNSASLGALALLFAMSVGIPLGVFSAVRRGTWLDTVARTIAMVGQATPSFWQALMLILVFSVYLKLLPAFGAERWQSYILPAVTLGSYPLAALLRLTRSSMLDVLDSEYVKMVRVKGLPERAVIWKHAFKNAALPVMTLVGLQLVGLINGAIIVESIFAWPGMGRLAVEAVSGKDFPLVQTLVIISSVGFVTMNLLVDILYTYVDPRIRYT